MKYGLFSLKMSVFWDVAPRNLADTDRRLRGAYCFHQGDEFILITEAVSPSETSVSINQTTKYNIPEDSHLHIRRHEKLNIGFLNSRARLYHLETEEERQKRHDIYTITLTFLW
jgi:hypothetical protein